MKKILILVSLFLCSQEIFAQLHKGMISIGLTSSVQTSKKSNEQKFTSLSVNNYYKNDVTKSTGFNITPTVSYFISNRFAVGLQVGYIGTITKTEQTYEYRNPARKEYSNTKDVSSGISVATYAKYYIPFNDHVFFFLKGTIGISNSSSGKTSGYDQITITDTLGNSTVQQGDIDILKTNTFQMNMSISPGLLFMPGKKIGLEFTLGNLIGINKSISDNPTRTTSTNLDYLNFNTLRVGTGIYYFF